MQRNHTEIIIFLLMQNRTLYTYAYCAAHQLTIRICVISVADVTSTVVSNV